MKNILNHSLALCVGLLSTHNLMAAGVDELETWNATNTAGWSAYDMVNQSSVSAVTVQSDALKLSFQSLSMPIPPDQYLIKSAARFTGNYMSLGIQGISFRLYPEYASTIQVAFHNDLTGQTWRYTIPGLVAGQWQTVTVPLDPFTLTDIDGATDMAAFKTALENVSWMGLIVVRNSSLSAQYTLVDDFRLFGAGSEYATWMAGFGGGDSLPNGDLDGDGISNFGEWVAGTSANDQSDVFKIGETAVAANGPGLVLRWASVAGRSYRVMRTDSISTPFTQVGVDVPATPPENVFDDSTATGNNAYFYKLEVVQ
jgi:hypothetical protein